jgi:uncharacterized SAM-binding protein YcdF (DUF218 family)
MKRLWLLLLAPVVAWTVGFAWFALISGRAPPPPPEADGIVALTGGAERVETALRLLADGRAPRLLVSGTGGGALLPELASRAGLDPDGLVPRVTLGRRAATTRGNAAETAAWVTDNNIHSLLVVTAGYHMPRALTELSRALPDVTLYPVPVTPPGMQGTAWLHHPRRVRLMAEEYTKWLLTRVGLSALGREPGRAAQALS